MFANSSPTEECCPAKQEEDSSVVDLTNSTGVPLTCHANAHLRAVDEAA